LTSDDSYLYPQGLADGRDALRRYLRSALKEAPTTNSLIELAESLGKQIPAFATKELRAQGKTFTIIEALELFESLELRTDAKTLKDLLDVLVREITRKRRKRS
jgi:hypothetical protein